MKKVELLSPAGNFDALKGAVNAGADAVYLGGERYGARAYADNFTTEEICEGIHYAHLFGRKIYLTVNTLVKEKELDGLYHFVLPFYEKGLDGVIIQDLGVLRFLRKYFPQLALHASTQMTITGAKGAALAREPGGGGGLSGGWVGGGGWGRVLFRGETRKGDNTSSVNKIGRAHV